MIKFSYKNIKIPTLPGCYLYKDGKGEVIYVGKAKNLRKRVSSYFVGKKSVVGLDPSREAFRMTTNRLDTKTQALVNAIRDVEFITTKTEVEALLLEQTLIHKYQPKFNIDLKGTLRYAYIKITDEKYPRLLTSRKLDLPSLKLRHGAARTAKYFGPYTDGMIRRQIINTLLKIFKIRTCVKLPKKVCLQYHIGNCTGPCQDYISREEYLVNVRNAERLLKGEIKEMRAEITERMREASRTKNYELAKSYRDQLHAIENIQEKNSVNQPKSYDQDVINWSTKDQKILFQIFNVKRGVITSRHTFTLDNYEGVVSDFIRHYYSINYIPEEIIVPEAFDDLVAFEKFARILKKEKFAFNYLPKVSVVIPEKGARKELLELVRQNIETTMGMEPGIYRKNCGLAHRPSILISLTSQI